MRIQSVHLMAQLCETSIFHLLSLWWWKHDFVLGQTILKVRCPKGNSSTLQRKKKALDTIKRNIPLSCIKKIQDTCDHFSFQYKFDRTMFFAQNTTLTNPDFMIPSKQELL